MDTFSHIPKLAIVVVNYGKQQITQNCIDSLLNEKTPKTIVLVDNGSPDCSVTFFRAYHRDLHQLENAENKGFCAGNNIGIAYAIDTIKADYILLLNNDTVVTGNTLEVLLDRARIMPNQLYMLTGKIRYRLQPQLLWYAGGRLSRLHGIGKHFGRNNPDSERYSIEKRVTYASGCFMFFPSELFIKIGPLKDRLFMYLDDTDYCMRLFTQGIPIYYLPGACILHDVGTGMTLSKYSLFYLYFSTRNRFWIGNNFAYKFYLALYTTAISMVKIVYILIHPSTSHRTQKAKSILLGILDGLSNKAPSIMHVRNKLGDV